VIPVTYVLLDFKSKPAQLGESMRRLLAVCLSISLFVSSLWAQVPQPSPEQILGFTAASSVTERDWEQKFKAIPKPELMKQYMQRLSARPHHVGSPYDKTTPSGLWRS